MTDNEIIKALECCGVKRDCAGCPKEKEPYGCYFVLCGGALDLINRQKAEIKQKDTEIDILIRKNERLKDEVSELRAEIERLKGRNKGYGFCNLLGNCLVYSKNLKDYNDMRKGLKSEAYKEFAERLRKRLGFCDLPMGIVKSHIEHLLTELTEQ